jgi:putative hydrolase of the HAD superfamily
MGRAVIFDFYGTLAHWKDGIGSNYTTVFAALGYELRPEVFTAYFDRYNGVAHSEHSVSAETYEAWVRTRLIDLCDGCAVPVGRRASVIDALRASDEGPMVAYPEARAALESIRDRDRDSGLTMAVCSNWGWELDRFLHEIGLLDLFDLAVTSARAGARKPHPSLYAHMAESLDVKPQDTVFVGDSWRPDVVGPTEAGMRAVHVWRPGEHPGETPPTLASGAERIRDLSELEAVLSW